MYALPCIASSLLLLTPRKDARGDQCDLCSRTLDAIELINPRCLVDKSHTVTRRNSAHMYVKLDAVQERTEEWIKKSAKLGEWSPNAVINGDGVLVDARLKAGMRPSPVTRDLTWGVPVPNLEGEDNQEMMGKVLCEYKIKFMRETQLIGLLRCLGKEM